MNSKVERCERFLYGGRPRIHLNFQFRDQERFQVYVYHGKIEELIKYSIYLSLSVKSAAFCFRMKTVITADLLVMATTCVLY